MEEDIKNKLYLNPIKEINIYRKKLKPIKQKILISSSEQSNASKSLPDLFKNLNGAVIMQNWSTKNNISKEIEEYTNYPSLIDKKKLLNIKKLNLSNLNINKKGKISLLDKIRKLKLEEGRIEPRKIESIKINDNNFNRISTKDYFKNNRFQM